MKQYSKPTTEALLICTENIIAASGKEQESVGFSGSGSSGNGVDLTRGKQGFGKGMWEDMK